MKIPFISKLFAPSFKEIECHTDKMKAAILSFQQAIDCVVSEKCISVEEHRQEIISLKKEADEIRDRALKKSVKQYAIPGSCFPISAYIKKQSRIIAALEETLTLISFRADADIPEELEKDFFLFIDAVVEPIEVLAKLVTDVKKYFQTFSGKQQKKIIRFINSNQHLPEQLLKLKNDMNRKIFSMNQDPMTIYYMVKLVESAVSISDNAFDASDMIEAVFIK